MTPALQNARDIFAKLNIKNGVELIDYVAFERTPKTAAVPPEDAAVEAARSRFLARIEAAIGKLSLDIAAQEDISDPMRQALEGEILKTLVTLRETDSTISISALQC